MDGKQIMIQLGNITREPLKHNTIPIDEYDEQTRRHPQYNKTICQFMSIKQSERTKEKHKEINKQTTTEQQMDKKKRETQKERANNIKKQQHKTKDPTT